MRRTMLFLPGNNPAMMLGGPYLGADSIIFDLEDAVSPAEKDAARILVRNALGALEFGPVEVVVRINALDTPLWERDLEAIVPMGPDLIMPPKSSDAGMIRRLDEKLGELEAACSLDHPIGILPLIETALGLENSFAIATASSRVRALFLGAEDLTADLGAIRSTEGEEILYARCRLVAAARAAGVEAIDTPFPGVDEMDALRRDAARARSLGFSGKAVINPRHIDIVNAAFSPSEAEIRYAEEVMEAIEEAKRQGKGAISLRGKMIDAPIVERARRVLAMARQIEGGDLA